MTQNDSWVLPSHGPVETLRTIRRLEFAGYLTKEEAAVALEEVCEAEVLLVAPEPWLLRAIWALRHTISPYDAAYAALARRFDSPLVTFDQRLARAAEQVGISAIVPY